MGVDIEVDLSSSRIPDLYVPFSSTVYTVTRITGVWFVRERKWLMLNDFRNNVSPAIT